MKRLVLALATGALAALLSIAPAGAQGYGGNPPPPPPPGPPAGCPVTDPPPANPPPCHPRERATVSDSPVRPGQQVTVSTPPVFAPNTPVTVNFVRANRGAQARELAKGNAGSNGASSQQVTIPQDAQPGVYFIYVHGVDANGNPVVAMTPVVVRAAGGGAQAASVQGDRAAAVAAPVPAAVAEAQADFAPGAEAAVVDAVTDGAGLVLSPDGALNVRTPAGLQDATTLPTTGANDVSQQVTIGAALLLAGTGLVLLRRRRGGFTK